jgi:NADPH:quinone reductase-like Zn-dependent oxidoreductase
LIPSRMTAVLLTGHGGLDQLSYRTDAPTPRPQADEVLIQVAAAAINNTDINTRIGWYSKTVRSDTGSGGLSGFTSVGEDSSWSGVPLSFPRIQGADVCGTIVAVGASVDPARLGTRVIVRSILRSYVDYRPYQCWTLGSECDGGFAQYTVAPARETHTVDCDWSDAELAAIPCAYSTAENMLHRAAVGSERVLITGASGGVGLAAVQLAKRRGATVTAVCSPDKVSSVRQQGADQVVERGRDLVDGLGSSSVDVVLDLVGGPQWAQLLRVLRVGGRYAVAGAIGGPMVELDLRSVYLKDLTVLGCTFQPDEVFENLIGYVERNEIRPVVAKTYPLKDIKQAQLDFLSKSHAGKLVLIPPATDAAGRGVADTRR